MTTDILEQLLRARELRVPCALATVAATKGSVPREAGSKMLVEASGRTVGTIGGGKFEALVIEDCIASLRGKVPVLKSYPLHESDPASFGAICGGEVTVLIEPQAQREAMVLVGAGHCARAIARLARECGFHVTVLDDRADLLSDFPADERIHDQMAPDFIAGRTWQADEALVIVSRNFQIDEDALKATLLKPGIGYVGMIGSQRKVRRVLDDLHQQGADPSLLARVYAPIGLDIGADSPAEIAVSVLAQILQVLRGRDGGHLKLDDMP